MNNNLRREACGSYVFCAHSLHARRLTVSFPAVSRVSVAEVEPGPGGGARRSLTVLRSFF